MADTLKSLFDFSKWPGLNNSNFDLKKDLQSKSIQQFLQQQDQQPNCRIPSIG